VLGNERLRRAGKEKFAYFSGSKKIKQLEFFALDFINVIIR
jgi:hypothetical protein